ncbi:MAG: hypothetical protein HUK20_10840 [Fibrobacter sp.]|nr:hypothetical protein [Fibrobacter sp.]
MKNTEKKERQNEIELVHTAQKGGKEGLKALNELLVAGTKLREFWANRAYECYKEQAVNLALEDYEQEAFFADREQILSYDPTKGAALKTHRINGIKNRNKKMAKKDLLHSRREKNCSAMNETNPFEDDVLFEETCSKDFRSLRLVDNDVDSQRAILAKELLVQVESEFVSAEKEAKKYKQVLVSKALARVREYNTHFKEEGSKKSFCECNGCSRTTLDKSLETTRGRLSKKTKAMVSEFLDD